MPGFLWSAVGSVKGEEATAEAANPGGGGDPVAAGPVERRLPLPVDFGCFPSPPTPARSSGGEERQGDPAGSPLLSPASRAREEALGGGWFTWLPACSAAQLLAEGDSCSRYCGVGVWELQGGSFRGASQPLRICAWKGGGALKTSPPFASECCSIGALWDLWDCAAPSGRPREACFDASCSAAPLLPLVSFTP